MRRALLAATTILLACATGRRAAAPGDGGLSFPPDAPETSALEAELAGKTTRSSSRSAPPPPARTTTRGRPPPSRRSPTGTRARRTSGRRSSGPAPRSRARASGGSPSSGSARWRRAPGREALEASFRAAEAHYRLDNLAAAHAALEGILARPALPAGERVRALAQRGVVELEQGHAEAAEATLREAIRAHETASATERLAPSAAAQARFYLGELRRAALLAAPLDPARADESALAAELERKSELLLAAQEEYLAAIRLGDERWAVAAGFRVGELYDALRAQVLDAPLPPGLDAGQAESYRAELRREVKVLAAKAMTAYEETLRSPGARGSRTRASSATRRPRSSGCAPRSRRSEPGCPAEGVPRATRSRPDLWRDRISEAGHPERSASTSTAITTGAPSAVHPERSAAAGGEESRDAATAPAGPRGTSRPAPAW